MADHTETFLPEPKADPRPPASEPSSDRTLGPYQLLFRIGGGGMADVWVAVRRGGFGFRQHFAVKTIRAEYGTREAFRAMFLDEARLASRVHHTNVLPVLDLGEDHGVVYQAMPLVDGDSVAALVKALGSRPMPLEAALRVAVDAARGLHAAHEAKDDDGRALELVHRDVSPQNILVGSDGVAKVSDFGIAKAFGTATDETSSHDVKGKRAYLAPEQLRKEPTDRRADVFALGVVIWELLAGKRCFPSGDSAMFFSLAKRIDDVRTARPEVPATVAEVVARAVEPEPAARFATSEALADALESAARAADLTPSAKQVGELVTQLLGKGVAERQRAIADQTSSEPTEPLIPITTDAAVVDTVVPTRARRRSVVAAGLAILGVAVAIVVWPRTEPKPAIAAKPIASEAPPAASSAPVLATPPVSATVTVTEAKPEPPPRASSPTKTARPPKPRATPQPKFSENPYAR